MSKVAIIGAGPAGLTAAYELLTRAPGEYEVRIFEESGMVGGISRTIQHNGNRMDIGGHRFFSKNRQVMDWWKTMMPLQGAPASDDIALRRAVEVSPGGPDPQKDDRVMLNRSRISRILFNKSFFDYPLRISAQTFLNLGLGRTLSAGLSYMRSRIKPLKEQNLEDFYINRFGRVVYSLFFESYTEKVWGKHPSQLSAAWGAQRVRGLSVSRLLADGIKKLLKRKDDEHVETSLIEKFWYPKFGPGQLWETVAKEITDRGGSILYNHKVEHIVTSNGAVAGVTCSTPDGEEIYECDIVISSMPLKDLTAALTPAPPERIAKIAEGLPYRDFITVGILVNRLKLKNNSKIRTLHNLVPDCWIYIQEPDVSLGRLQIFNNWSPYMVAHPDTTVWIGCEYFCNEDDKLWNLSSDEMQKYAISELSHLGIIDENDVIDSCSEKVKKAYPAYFGTYEDIDTLRDYINNIKGLYCVGRNGQHRYNNMDHSMLTSFLCVQHILNNTSCAKDCIWQINSESSYHEETKKQ